jgi:hypothetical protein
MDGLLKFLFFGKDDSAEDEGNLPAVQPRGDGKSAAKRVRTAEAFGSNFGFFSAEKKDRLFAESLGDSQCGDFITESHGTNDEALNFLFAEEADNFTAFSIIADKTPVGQGFIGDDDFKVGDFGEDAQAPFSHLSSPIFIERDAVSRHKT